jgi:hydrogenase nickel incorporation protein HypA/HybF
LHELAIAQSIVESAAEEAFKAKAKRVTSIEVDVGELMQLDVKALRQAFKMLMSGPMLKGARVSVEVSPASFACNRCGERWGMPEARRQLDLVADELRVREPDSVELPLHFLPQLYPAFVRCPKCGSADSEAVEGEDLVLRRVVVE